MKYIYVPLERLDMRYTSHLDDDITTYLNDNNIQYIRIYPDIDIAAEPPDGLFLNPGFTTKFKSLQLAEIARLYETNSIQNDDVFFFSDLWFPGIESIAYMNYFYKKETKITGIIHAGSFTDTDFIRDCERWAKNFEDIIFDISSDIYVGSNFIKRDIVKKRIVNPEKIKITPFPYHNHLGRYNITNEKENIVIFNGRNCDEKQPWLFVELEKQIKNCISDVKFINTQKLKLPKEEYYKLLNKAKVIVSFALQENFGFGILEATYLGCNPVVPNRLVYPELYPVDFLYNNFTECVELVKNQLLLYYKMHQLVPTINTNNTIQIWFNK
ncbi:MAG: hypothetical protein M0R17_09125 [Candidatus Omnitrophica bacterium]|jgi:hypothetical protein|nr:hypothetical protein [Candidatus Omnitrophota bacterium]